MMMMVMMMKMVMTNNTHFLVLHLPPADGKSKFAELLTNLKKLWEDQAAMI